MKPRNAQFTPPRRIARFCGSVNNPNCPSSSESRSAVMPMSRTGWKDHFAEQIGDGPDGTTINLKK